jgi:hypothetical protein
MRWSTGLRHVRRGEIEEARDGERRVAPSLPQQAWVLCPIKPLLPIFRHQPGITDRSQRQRVCTLTYHLAIAMPQPTMPAALVVLLRSGAGYSTDRRVTI